MLRGCLRLAVVAITAALSLCGQAMADGPVTSPVTRVGKWVIDDQGRVVIVHGIGIVVKDAPFYPSLFGTSDARLFANEGLTAAREGFIWAGMEPQPGKYDDAYIQHNIALNSLLARYGIRALIDFHQDAWRDANGGDGAPGWASPSTYFGDNFEHFWNNDPAPDGVGVQTHFINLWRHVIQKLDTSSASRNIWGLDPFNEPQPGSGYPDCGPYVVPCPAFEQGPLGDFYKRLIPAVRSTGDRHIIWPEDMAQNGPGIYLPGFSDSQTAYNFHYYCPITQTASSSGPLDAACAPYDQKVFSYQLGHAYALNVPAMVSEFSSSDANDENQAMVDRMGGDFLSWTIWAYYTKDPAGTPTEGVLINDSKPGSEANAKQPKLDAIVVPYPQAIAGTPGSWAYDRSSATMTLTYRATPVPGARLRPRALTQIFVPRRHYPHGYRVSVAGARVVSPPTSPWVQLQARRGANVSVAIAPAMNSTTQWPLSACPTPSGTLRGESLGPLSLGETRTRARRTLVTFGLGSHNYDNFCVFAGDGIGAGYGTPKLVPRVDRKRLAGRIVLLVTANPFYALGGVRAGTRLTRTEAKRLRLGKPLRIGADMYFVMPLRRSVGVLDVRRGIVQVVGLASKQVTRTRKAQRALLSTFRAADRPARD